MDNLERRDLIGLNTILTVVALCTIGILVGVINKQATVNANAIDSMLVGVSGTSAGAVTASGACARNTLNAGAH